MKLLITILAGLSTLTLPLFAQEKDSNIKSQLAINYLKKVAQGELDIAKDTALSPNCSISRRKSIREHLNLLQSNYLRENDTFTVESVKDGDQFSAVLIRAENPSAPLSSRVFSIALIRKKDGWKPAPLPDSFANTDYGYDEAVENTVKNLEKWMATEKIKRETAHRNKATNEFQSALAKIEKELNPTKLNARTAVENFIELCRSKDLMKILASMGAASGALQESLEDTISVVSGGLEVDDLENDWQVVTNRSSVYEVMNVDEKRNEVAVGFYNPMLRRQSKVLYFPIVKKENKTFVRLSPMLMIALLPEDERWQQRWRHRREDERNLVVKIPATILKNTKTIPADSPEKLLETFLSIVKANQFKGAIELLPRKGHHFEKEKEQAIVLANLATLWQGLNGVKSSPAPKITVVKEELLALAPLQYALPNNPGRFQTWNLWMLKGEQGWHLVPQNSMNTIEDEALQLSKKKLLEQLVKMTQNQRKELSQKMLSQVLTIKPASLGEAVNESDAIKLFKQYRNHLRGDDNQAALGCCAVLDGTDDTRTLKNFNYALRGVDDHIKDDRILGVITAGKWSGISVRTESKLAGTHDYPVYLCLNTSKGARILLDIDLRHPSNKGRKLLNKSNWGKLKNAVPAETLKQVETIFAKHEKLVTADKDAEKKLHE